MNSTVFPDDEQWDKTRDAEESEGVSLSSDPDLTGTTDLNPIPDRQESAGAVEDGPYDFGLNDAESEGFSQDKPGSRVVLDSGFPGEEIPDSPDVHSASLDPGTPEPHENPSSAGHEKHLMETVKEKIAGARESLFGKK